MTYNLYAAIKDNPDSLTPLNFPGPLAHLKIRRTRKRQIERAKWMMIQHDHTCYEWSQYWPKAARKPKRWK